MRVKQRLELIDKLGRELQAKYGYSDIDVFLNAFGISPPSGPISYNSKWVYSKEALKNADDKVLTAIAEELEVNIPSIASFAVSPPQVWQQNDVFRLFVSHIAIHKDKAKRLKETLASHHIAGFVAHEDITPTKEWQKEIERALFTMDAMLTIHTRGFSESVWTQQEIGFALGRGMKIISLRMDEDPKGFISKDQAILRRGRDAAGVAEEIASILTSDSATKARMAEIKAMHQQIEDEEIPF
ncbi:MAG: toll/interleukin-1 receptor domain-containing protein [Sphingomonadales bacterium]|nr:toll/interleukin-1 receptor domain-containing protein [Sphingomonadales bacterium]RIK91978.1 MAG: TIR domain-containing protein [Pseudomonadota bacterium]